jgi:hypothetical protein
VGNPFSSSQKVIALCDVCGFQYKLRELKNLFVKGRDTNVKACRECWSPDHPQLRLGELPVHDPQAVRDPRVDQSIGPAGDTSSRDIQWGWNPVGGGNDPFGLTPSTLLGTGVIGQVTVTTT